MDALTTGRLSSRLTRGVVFILLVVLAVIAIYPVLWLVTNSFKTQTQIFDKTWALPTEWHWETYVQAWQKGVARYIFNSIVVTTSSVLITAVISLLAAYALSRFHMVGHTFFLMLVLGGLMLAPQVSLIPLFRILQTLGLYDTYFAMILPYVAFGIPFTTFLIRSYILGIPRELEEAAHIDGAGSLTVLWHIIIPLSRPILASASVVLARRVWNEFMFALTFVESEQYKTLTVGMMSFASALRTDWPTLMAGLVIAAIPMFLLFLLTQRQFVRGLREGGIK